MRSSGSRCWTRCASSPPSGRRTTPRSPTPSSGTRATSSSTRERLAKEAARAHRRDSLERLAGERANLRLAYERLLRGGAAGEALRVAIAFAEALPWDAHTHEVRGWLAGGLAALTEEAPELRATALYWDGRLAISQARFSEAEPRLRGRARGRARGGRA